MRHRRAQDDNTDVYLFWATVIVGIGMFIASISIRVDAPAAKRHPTSKACPAPTSQPSCNRFLCPRKENLK